MKTVCSNCCCALAAGVLLLPLIGFGEKLSDGNGDGKCTLGVHIRKLSVSDSAAASDSAAK